MYELPPLRYALNALEPYISERTVDIHYHRHHQGYLDKLNNFLNSVNYDYRYSLEELINHIDEFPINIRGQILYNAGGVLNHNLYWNSIGPGNKNIPVGTIKEAIDKEFGSFENFKEEFMKQAGLVVGSGWTFLVINGEGKLEIINTSNQETPYLYGLKPIMALDLWEHAYYLDYQNRRDQYISNFFQIVDFDMINKLYEKEK
ncbi:MAG: superoxide dismutase [Mollicutes bacterium]|nr:superoxide dismutase [Mollicutes bacterium]